MNTINIIARLGDRSARLAQRIIPDPFIIAIGLGVITLAIGLLTRKEGFIPLCESYAKGMFATPLLAFAFKMALILITGHALAAARPVQVALGRLASIPRTTSSAAAIVALVSMLLAYLNWGVGLVGGAFLAREIGRQFDKRGESLNYPLIGAAGYMGLLVWHGGLSGSAPLAVASDSSFGLALGVKETIFSRLNLIVAVLLLLVIPLLFWALGKGPAANNKEKPSPQELQKRGIVQDELRGAVSRVENSAWVAAIFLVPILIALASWVRQKGTGAINFDLVILSFWVLGMILHRTPMAYARAFGEGVRESTGILLQFPLYFGILAVARDSGLIEITSQGLSGLAVQLDGVIPVSITAPIFTFFSSGLVNLLVPSGGGQWALQAPIIADMTTTLDLDRTKMLMAFCYGDQITNMLQPFWALPLLSITGLQARQIMGYTILAMLVATPVFVLLLACM